MKQVYLLAGRPGIGKTRLIKQAIVGMKGEAGGFYTEEMRSQGVRQGFRLITLDGQEAILAHINIRSPYRVGKYGIDIDNLDQVGVSALHKAAQQCNLVIIDEIGRMELFSANFRKAVSQIIDGGRRILGTVMLAPEPWVDAIKRHPQVNLVTVIRNNHQDVLEELLKWLEATESCKL